MSHDYEKELELINTLLSTQLSDPGFYEAKADYEEVFTPEYVKQLVEKAMERDVLAERVEELERDYLELASHHNQHCTCLDIY